MVGTNDFTVLDEVTHAVTLVTPFTSGLIVCLKVRVHTLSTTLATEYSHIDYHIFRSLYRLDINQFNRLPGTYRYQDALNHVIGCVDDIIGKLNNANGVVAPFINNNIFHGHHSGKGTYTYLQEELENRLGSRQNCRVSYAHHGQD